MIRSLPVAAVRLLLEHAARVNKTLTITYQTDFAQDILKKALKKGLLLLLLLLQLFTCFVIYAKRFFVCLCSAMQI